MKKIILLLLLSLFSSQFGYALINEIKKDTTVYYFIRHAEKNRQDKTNKNPKLIDKGLKRAENWCQKFQAIKFNAIYSTDYARTLATAKPTATDQKLNITLYNPNEINYDAFKKETKNKKILIVGHSNTIPDFVNAILRKKKYKDIEDKNNSNLYVITIIGNTVKDELELVNF